MKGAISGSKRPAKGLLMIATPAARRNGVAGGGPNSWKISSR
jgi:hypothetical protein